MELVNARAKSDGTAIAALFADPFVWGDSLAKSVRKTQPVNRTMGIRARRFRKAAREVGFLFIKS